MRRLDNFNTDEIEATMPTPDTRDGLILYREQHDFAMIYCPIHGPEVRGKECKPTTVLSFTIPGGTLIPGKVIVLKQDGYEVAELVEE